MEQRPAILVVDDTPANRRLVEAILRDTDADLLQAESGEQALRLCTEREFVMILLDVSMPDMDGFETARSIRGTSLNRHTPIVFVSAVFRSSGDIRLGYTLGAVDYILSPVLREVLHAKAEVFLDLYRMRQESVRQARQLEATNRALLAANEELESFSYSASHDLRAPLRHISGFAQALLDDHADRLDEEGRDYLDRIVSAAQSLSSLIDDLLKLATITCSGLDVKPCDLSAIAQDIAASLRRSAPERHVEWTIAPGLAARGDAGLLHAALTNLFDNAWKFTSKTDDARIEFGSNDRDGTSVFFVRDNGVGFNAARPGNGLFKPFHRMHRADDFPGTGIGLAIVHRVIAKHGGRIWAESKPGKGAAFYFTLAE